MNRLLNIASYTVSLYYLTNISELQPCLQLDAAKQQWKIAVIFQNHYVHDEYLRSTAPLISWCQI